MNFWNKFNLIKVSYSNILTDKLSGFLKINFFCFLIKEINVINMF